MRSRNCRPGSCTSWQWSDEAQVGLDHFLLGDARFALALLHHVHDAAEFRHRNAGLGRQVLDLAADVADRLVFLAGKILPATGREVADRLHPVRVEFRTLILLEETVALDAVGFGETQQLALVLHETLVDVVELLDQAVDAVLIERQRLDRRDQLILELLVAAFLAGRQGAGAGKARLDLLVLQLAELLVGVGDRVEGFHDLRAQFRFHGGQRQVRFVLVLFLLFRRSTVAADIGDVVVAARRAGAAGLFLLLGRLAVGFDLFRALELRRSLGLGAGIGGFEIDDLAQKSRAFVEFVAPDDQRLEGQRAFAQAGDHRLAAGLDALGDGDFAFARQKLDRTHLAQIHAHRVVRAVGRLFLLGGRQLRALRRRKFAALAVTVAVVVAVLGRGRLFGVLVLDDVDTHVGQHGHGVLDLLGGDFLRRQDRVQFIHGDIAALLGGLDHFFDRVIRKVEKRTVGSAVAFAVCFFVFFDFGCHLFRRFPDV